MKLSFIIISYNEAEYLPQAIESCLQQNLTDFEIIIGDDGSDDGSDAIIARYARENPSVIRHFVSDRSDVVPGKVIASVRVTNLLKRAFEIAQGDYCLILSGDDYLYAGSFLSDAIRFLDDHPDHITYVGGFEKVWADRPSVAFQSHYPPSLYWSGGYIHLSCFVFRKSIYDKGLLLERFCDDTGLHYSLAFSGKWRYADDRVFAYRQRSGSIMHEADPLELHLVELMQFQDVLCKGKLLLPSLSRFSVPLRYVFRNRRRIGDDKYQKYRESCDRYEHNVLRLFHEYDSFGVVRKLRLRAWLLSARILGFVYRWCRKLYALCCR